MSSWIQVLDKATNTFNKKTTFVCGHSAEGYDIIAARDEVKLFRDYLDKTLQFVDGEIKAGKTRAEIVKATGIPGATEWKGDGIDRPLGAAFDELTVKS